MSDELEDRVRQTLRDKAAAVQPAGGGLEAIQRKLAESPATAAGGRRARGPWLVAAAAAVVVAVVGGTLVSRDDGDRDRTVVAAGPESGAGSGAPLLDAVWPTDSPAELAAMDDDALAAPDTAAAAYLADRLERPLTAENIEVDGSTATVRDDAAAPTVELGELDGRWYVRRTTSDLLEVDVSWFEGDVVGTVAPAASGDLTVLVDEDEAHQGFADAGEVIEVDHDSDERAVVRTTLVGDAGSATFDERLVVAGRFSAYPTLDAVWPTDDPEVLRGISAAWARDDSPLPAVKLYLQDRLERTPADDELTIVEAGSETEVTAVAVTGDAGLRVQLRRLDGEIWYVQRASSELLVVDAAFDGERVAGSVVPGEDGDLEISYSTGEGGGGGSTPASAGEPLPLDYEMPPSTSFVLQVVQPSSGALHEERFLAPPDAPVPPAAGPDAPEPPSVGVWPKPIDEISTADLVDPVDVARLYLMDTADLDQGIELSDFRQGDSHSGEVEVTGDVVATIALRRIEDRWHVEAVHTPLVEARGDVPGELWLHANVEGVLTVTVLDAWGTVVQSMPEKLMVEGEEVVVVPAEPVHKPFSVRYSFAPVVGNPSGLGDVAVSGTSSSPTEPVEHEVPDEAIFAAGGLDPIGTAQEYISARLGFIPDDMRLVEGFSGEDNATVDWQDGSVFLIRHDDYWYVTESIGSSVSFTDITVDGDEVRVDLFLGEPGTFLVQLLDAEGGVCSDTQMENPARGEGGVVFEDVPCDVESVVATMNEVIAEQAP